MTTASLTELEKAVLHWIRFNGEEDIDCDAFGALLRTATVTDRENTGVGFYTTMAVDRGLPPCRTYPKNSVDGPNPRVKVGDQVALMGFILWLEAGYPAELEGYQLVGDIDLQMVDLFAIRFVESAGRA